MPTMYRNQATRREPKYIKRIQARRRARTLRRLYGSAELHLAVMWALVALVLIAVGISDLLP